MWFRVRKRFKIGKFFRINLSKSGIGYSTGIPGTGVSWGVSPSRRRVTGPKGHYSACSCSGCLILVAAGFVVLMVIGFVNSKPRDLANRGSTVDQESKTDSLPPGLAVGERVEIVARLVCADLDIFRRRPADGGRPANTENGTDVFGVVPGSAGTIASFEPGAVQVHIEDGNWKGRTGWVRPDEVRKTLTEAESAADTIDGFAQSVRREIYQANWRAGMKASRQADSEYPFTQIPADASAQYLEKRKLLYDTVKAEGQNTVMSRYGINQKQLDAIDQEGGERKWPLGEE